jgi:uncharacterized protein
MGWIQTYSGKSFDPEDPRPEDFDLRDIAHALSLQCRFNGHCRVFYSVAEHSVRVSRICSPDHALWGLLHDMAEAYVGDLPRPIKVTLLEFQRHEARVLQAACVAFHLDWPMPPSVKRADDILLATEARDLMAPPPKSWRLSEKPLSEVITPLTSLEAEAGFLRRYAELMER